MARKTISQSNLDEARSSPAALRRMVFWLALPAVGEQVLNNIVGLTDQYLVGNLEPAVSAQLGYDQATALTSVGLGNMLVWIATTLFMTVAIGATAIVARRIGEGKDEEAHHALRQALLISFAVGTVSTAVAYLFAEPLIGLLGGDASVTAAGGQYLRILSLSFIPSAFMFAGTAALRGAGDTRTPLYLMGAVNIVNVVLSWLLVNGHFGFPGLGVVGSAIGSAAGRSLAGFILVFLFMSGRMRLKISRDWRPDWTSMRSILKIGLPSAGERFIFQSALIVMARLLTGLGTAAYAAHGLTITVGSTAFLPGYGFGIAGTALVGQYLGANDPKLAERAGWEAWRQGFLMVSTIGMILAIWPATIASWFTSDPDIIAYASQTIRIQGLGQPFLGSSFILVGALRGAGDTTWPVWLRMVTAWGVRMPLIFFVLWFTDLGLPGVWMAMFCDFVMQGVMAAWRFKGGKWKSIKV